MVPFPRRAFLGETHAVQYPLHGRERHHEAFVHELLLYHLGAGFDRPPFVENLPDQLAGELRGVMVRP